MNKYGVSEIINESLSFNTEMINAYEDDINTLEKVKRELMFKLEMVDRDLIHSKMQLTKCKENK